MQMFLDGARRNSCRMRSKLRETLDSCPPICVRFPPGSFAARSTAPALAITAIERGQGELQRRYKSPQVAFAMRV